MLHKFTQALFGCHHSELSRVFTISVKYPNGFRIRTTYQCCITCGQQWHYDLATMQRGPEIERRAVWVSF